MPCPQTTSESREVEISHVASLEATMHSLESQLEETRQVSVHVVHNLLYKNIKW